MLQTLISLKKEVRRVSAKMTGCTREEGDHGQSAAVFEGGSNGTTSAGQGQGHVADTRASDADAPQVACTDTAGSSRGRDDSQTPESPKVACTNTAGSSRGRGDSQTWESVALVAAARSIAESIAAAAHSIAGSITAVAHSITDLAESHRQLILDGALARAHEVQLEEMRQVADRRKCCFDQQAKLCGLKRQYRQSIAELDPRDNNSKRRREFYESEGHIVRHEIEEIDKAYAGVGVHSRT